MKFYAETLGLSDTAFALLRDLVHERTGLYYDNDKCDLLADKLSPLVIERGFGSFLDYYYYLKYDPNAGGEWQRVMDALSVPETYFWREIDQVQALVNVVVPQFFAANPGVPLRIWCAACASGEEPLTIAMALHQAGWLDRAPIELMASDASPNAIEKARRGLYRDRSFRALPLDLKARYFVYHESEWEVDPALLARIRYQVANLITDDVSPLACSTAIFCRNVFIYFSDQAIRSTASLFFRYMHTPGYLFVGASESLMRFGTEFEIDSINGAFVYVKKPKGNS